MKKSCYPTLLLLLLMQSLLQAQPLTPMVDSILMRDGRKLAASIHIPAGCVGACPVILIQTPYNRQLYNFTGLPLGIGMNLNNSNYIFVFHFQHNVLLFFLQGAWWSPQLHVRALVCLCVCARMQVFCEQSLYRIHL